MKTVSFRSYMLVLISAASFYSCQFAKAAAIIQPKHEWGAQIPYYSPIGQTFKAEDEHISAIGFWLEDIYPEPQSISAKIELFKGAGIGGQSLGAAFVEGHVPGFKGFFDADFSFVELTSGQMYTAIVSCMDYRVFAFGSFWRSDLGVPFAPDPYSNGDIIVQGNINYNGDAAFRIIPEPATVLLFALGGFALRKKR